MRGVAKKLLVLEISEQKQVEEKEEDNKGRKSGRTFQKSRRVR